MSLLYELHAVVKLFMRAVLNLDTPLERWQKRACFHHDEKRLESWIRSELIDFGRTKRYWCSECGQSWTLNDIQWI